MGRHFGIKLLKHLEHLRCAGSVAIYVKSLKDAKTPEPRIVEKDTIVIVALIVAAIIIFAVMSKWL